MSDWRMVGVMSTTLTISDDLALALETRRQQAGMPSLDAAAEVLLADALAGQDAHADGLGLSDEELRALIEDGEASGPPEAWDGQATRKAIRLRFAASRAG